MKTKMEIFDVSIEDENYGGQACTYSGLAKTMEEATEKALKRYRRIHRLAKHEAPLKPFVRSVRLHSSINF